MPSKQYVLNDTLTVTVHKRRRSRSLRLRLAADGQVNVSIPPWLPFRAGLDFARSKQIWIARQQRPKQSFKDGDAVGKAHHLHLQPSRVQTVTSRVIGSQVIVKHPEELPPQDPAVQQVVRQACLRALRKQADQLLPQRLAALAAQHGYSYKSVRVRALKSRWGSCDQHRNIVLNIYLVQLPWSCIDYVLLHELAHTEHLNHSPDFWQAVKQTIPNVTTIRKQLRAFQPTVFIAEA